MLHPPFHFCKVHNRIGIEKLFWNVEGPNSRAKSGWSRYGLKTKPNQEEQELESAEATFLNVVVKVYCTHSEPDYSLPWQKQKQFSSTGSAFMIGDGKLLTNAHCVEHDIQVKVRKRGGDTKCVARVYVDGELNECTWPR